MTTEFDESRWTGGALASKTSRDRVTGKGLDNLALHALAHIADQHHRAELSPEAIEAMRTQHVTALAHALADADSPLAETMVEDLLEAGVTVETLCADHLAPAARELGLWWETDEMPFAKVTLATARIQTILRLLPGNKTPHAIKAGKGALFAAVPGEDHTLGVLMAADHFRRLGWDVGLLIGMDHAEARARIMDDDRPVLGLSCTSAQAVENLRRLVEDVRRRRPDLAIVLSGRIACDETVLKVLPRFDGIVTRLDGAERILRNAVRGARAQSAD